MDLSRRDMLGQIALALEHAHHAVQTKPGFSVLTPEMASKIEALTSAIIPSDDGPGAREAGVVYFIDRALATFDAGKLEEYRAGLAAGDDIAAIEKTRFFETLRAHTLMGFLGSPSYGGNRGHVGWKQIGMDHRMAWLPPFGYYDAEAAKK